MIARSGSRARSATRSVKLVASLCLLAAVVVAARAAHSGDNRVAGSPPVALHGPQGAAAGAEIGVADLTHPSRPANEDERQMGALRRVHGLVNGVFVSDPAVDNTTPTFKNTDLTGGTEPSVALNPLNPQQIVMTSFSGGWGANAPLWYSTNG